MRTVIIINAHIASRLHLFAPLSRIVCYRIPVMTTMRPVFDLMSRLLMPRD
jgi:hypothetical protein